MVSYEYCHGRRRILVTIAFGSDPFAKHFAAIKEMCTQNIVHPADAINAEPLLHLDRDFCRMGSIERMNPKAHL